MPVPLSHEILDEWLAAVVAAGAPIDAILGEGLTAKELDDIQAAFQRPVPNELTILWSWRRFAVPARQLGFQARILAPDEAAEVTSRARGWYDDAREEGTELDGWSHDYLIWNNSHPYWFSVDVSIQEPVSPVLLTVDADITEAPDLVAHSLGDLFLHWTALIRTGEEHFDGHWQYRDGPLSMYPAPPS